MCKRQRCPNSLVEASMSTARRWCAACSQGGDPNAKPCTSVQLTVVISPLLETGPSNYKATPRREIASYKKLECSWTYCSCKRVFESSKFSTIQTLKPLPPSSPSFYSTYEKRNDIEAFFQKRCCCFLNPWSYTQSLMFVIIPGNCFATMDIFLSHNGWEKAEGSNLTEKSRNVYLF